jgi:hypothetical protein
MMLPIENAPATSDIEAVRLVWPATFEDSQLKIMMRTATI